MTRVKVTGRSFRYRGERYRHGDTFEAEDGVLEKHPRTLSAVDGDEATDQEADAESDDEEAAGEGGTVTVDDLDPHPANLKVGELEERIADVEDVELLETIRDAEEATEDRTTAKDAIDARLNEIED